MNRNVSLSGVTRNDSHAELAISADRNLAYPQCLLCGGLRHRPVFDEFGIDILRCEECGHLFSSYPADPHYDEFWGDEVADGGHFYWSQARIRMHEVFFRRFMAGTSGRLLDMGCGLGFFLRSAASYTGWEAYGCEISPAAVRYAREKLGLENVICGRLEEVDLPQESFDIITMWDVLDHIPQPDALLRRCHALLRPGGICFIRTPNVTVQLLRARLKRLVLGTRPSLAYMMARDHCHQYSMDSIRRLLGRDGFLDVDFVHLPPIGATTSGKDMVVRVVKNACFTAVRALAAVSFNRLNFDNLYAVAHKAPTALKHGL